MSPFFCNAAAQSCYASATVYRRFVSSLALSRSASCVARNRFDGVLAQSPLPTAGAPGRWRPGLLFA